MVILCKISYSELAKIVNYRIQSAKILDQKQVPRGTRESLSCGCGANE